MRPNHRIVIELDLRVALGALVLFLAAAPFVMRAATRDGLHRFQDGTVASAGAVNENFELLAKGLDATAASVPEMSQGPNWVRIGNVQWAWGEGCAGTGDRQNTITLPRPYANASYSVTVMRKAMDGTGYRTDYALRSQTTNGFVFHSPQGTGTTNCFDWSTVGFFR